MFDSNKYPRARLPSSLDHAGAELSGAVGRSWNKWEGPASSWEGDRLCRESEPTALDSERGVICWELQQSRRALDPYRIAFHGSPAATCARPAEGV